MKQKTGRRLLSFLLTLAMVIGLFPGMSLTAYAAEPQTPIFTFTESDNTCDLKGKDTTINDKANKITKIEAIIESEGAEWARIQWGYYSQDEQDQWTIPHITGNYIDASAGVHKSTVEGDIQDSQYGLVQVVHTGGNGKLWWVKVYFNDNTSVEIGDSEYPEFTVPTNLTATVGQTLANVTLPTVTNGTWAWVTETTSVGEVGTNTFNATFTPTDSTLHTVTNIAVPVTVAAHTHDFIYSASGATITAACNGVGTCGLTEKKATLTIAAPTLTTYGGTGDAAATLTGLDDFNTATSKNIAATDIKYIGRDGTTYAESATAPTSAGKYTAKITLEGVKTSAGDDQSVTASVDYEIVKADPTAPTGLIATYGQKLSDVALPTGWTWADSTQSVGNVVSPAANFKANFAGDDNYNAASNVDVTVTVGKAANPATVSGTATVTKGANTVDLASNVTLNRATGEVTYVIDGEANGCSLTGSTLTSGENAGTVTVNVTVAEDSNYNALAATPITVTISDKGTQTITASDVTVTYGETGKKVEATTDGDGAISYAVKEGSADYIDVDATTGALTINKVGTATVIVTAEETSTYAQVTKEVTVTINKASAVAATVTANSRTYDGTDKPLVNVDNSTLMGGEMWYAVTSENKAPTDDNLYTTSIPTATDAGTYYVWYKVVGDDSHTEPVCITVTIGQRPSAPSNPVVVPSTPTTAPTSAPSPAPAPAPSPTVTDTPAVTAAPVTEAYTIPVSNENTVDISANISEGNAVVQEITQADLDKITETPSGTGSDGNEKAEDTTISIDVSNAKSEVTSVELSGISVETLAKTVEASEKVDSVEIKMTNATVELDGAAVSAISEQKEGNTIKLVVENKEQTKLNETQKEALKDFPSVQLFQAYFESGGKEIHDFKGGKATVSIKFKPETGKDVKHYHMYYVPLSGLIERYVTRYLDGMLTFVTTHFSDYAIVYDETMENET